jgi:hypothetical protein
MGNKVIKLKVFWINKPVDEREIPLYRGDEETKNILNVSIKGDSPIKYLWITNSENTNYIFTLYTVEFKKVENNKLTLLISDEQPIFDKVKQADKPDIFYSDQNNISSDYIEVATVTKANSLLDNNYVILLPKGSFIVKFEKGITETEVVLQYSKIEI